MKKENITLVGMPGAGKSTVGVVLAKIAGYHFLDSDLLIQQKTGKLLHELIEIHGREGFLEIEGEINASIDTKCTVIATGGSVVYEENAMQHLKEISTVVYIYLPYEELRTRLGSLEQRGVALKPEETLKDLYDSRSVLYKNMRTSQWMPRIWEYRRLQKRYLEKRVKQLFEIVAKSGFFHILFAYNVHFPNDFSV